MNKSNVVSLVVGLIVGFIIGGLTAALVNARYNEAGASYELHFIMRQIDLLNKRDQENKDLQKKIQELEQRAKNRP